MTFKDLNNLYEVRRAVRFELFRKGTTYIDTTSKVDSKDRMQTIYRKLQDLVSTYKEFISLWGNTIFKQDDDARKKIEFFPDESKGQDIDELINTLECNKTVLFKFSGIEKTFKDDRFKNKGSLVKRNKKGLKIKNHISVDSSNFLGHYFRQRIKDNIALSREIEKFNTQQNNLGRLSDLSFSVGLLQTQRYLKKLFILFEGDYIDHKNDTDAIITLGDQLFNIEELIITILDATKPQQSLGLPIEYVTLNYYTRNKTPKEYDDEIENKELALNKPYTGFDQNTKLYGIDRNASIESVHRQMKEFKAREKSAFFERLQKKVPFTALNDSFDYIDNKGNNYEEYVLQLFSNENDISEQNYNQLLELTKAISQLDAQINDKTKTGNGLEQLEQERTKKKIKRGKFLMYKKDSNESNNCVKYISFCENYKKIAMEYGKRKAEVNSLKREKLEAEKRRNWGFFIERDGKYSLITILSDRSNDAFQGIKNDLMLGSNEKPNVRYFILSSITLRALDKLCFAKNSTFAKNIRNKIDQQFLGEYNMKSKTALKEEKILLDFYNEILDRQTSLDLRWRSENSQQILRDCRTEDEFEIVLKQETYIMKELQTTDAKMQQFLEKYSGEEYEISSWDLRGKGSTLTQDGNGARDHEENFTQWRKSFWSNENKNEKYPIRVNPEMIISFVEKDKEFIEKHENQTNNRRSRDRLLLTTTVSYYADKSYIDGGFIDDEERKNNNTKFSELYNREKNPALKYFYGLDRGINELVTLGIFEKGADSKMKSVYLDQVEIYKITDNGLLQSKEVVNKDGTKKIHTLYKNPSMFIDKISDSTVFEKVSIESCIGNLTCAKVIDGKIVLNGDINTLKKLYEINAKRFLFLAIKEQGRTGTKIEYNSEEEIFYYEIGEKTQAIYYLENVKNIVSKDEIEQMLNEYIAHIDDQDISIAKINHLRNAICANIVGVMMKLQEKYPGYIVWENITISDDNRHSVSSHTNLGNLIVEKIYNKLHFLKEVPPILKKFRSDIKANLQHGKVLYINKDETSSLCPCCGGKLGGHLTEFENTMKHFSDEEYDATYNDMAYPKFKKENSNDRGMRKNRWKANQIDGEECIFQIGNLNSNFSYLKSGDDLATYNIAKRGQEFLQSDRY